MNRFYILIVLAVYFVAQPVNAEWFEITPEITVDSNDAVIEISNKWDETIYCDGVAVGLTYYGEEPVQMVGRRIYPGQSNSFYLRSSYGDPFVGVWTEIYCRFESLSDSDETST